MKSTSLIFFSFLLSFGSVHARSFKNAYISFEIPDNWRCKPEASEFVCRAEEGPEGKEAVIILTAKEKGPTDTLGIYRDHLGKPMPLALKTGASSFSTVTMPPRDYPVGGQVWIDALHLGSEVPNYYTRYLATIKSDQIAILATFSVHSKYYEKHANHFVKTVNSMKVIATKELLARPESGPLRGSNEMLGPAINHAMPADLLASDDLNGDAKTSGGGLAENPMLIGFGILLLAAIAYVFLKLRKK